MYENSNEKKNIFYIVVLILTLITMVVGITFALYSLMASQKKDGTVLYTGKLELNFKDGIYIDNPTLFPRSEPSYDETDNVYRNNFVITSTGTMDQNITISLNITENTFSTNYLKYALYNVNGQKLTTGYLPSSGEIVVASNIYLDYDESASYLLLIWFNDNGSNQNSDMGSKLSGTIDITSKQIIK